MKSYRKRAKAGWCGGKSYKQQANSAEREYAKREIEQELKQMHEGEDFRYTFPSRKTRTALDKAKSSLKWYEERLEYYNRPNIKAMHTRCGTYFFNDHLNHIRSQIKKLEETVKNLQSK